jgi:hypothetical protein
MPLVAMLFSTADLFARHEICMKFEPVLLNKTGSEDRGSAEKLDLGSLPPRLSAQCQSLIESYHDIHGYVCLPNMLWRADLGGFIQKQPCLRRILRKSSTSRSAKIANHGFVQIATALLSLEILASDFASWSTLYPQARTMANALLRTRGARMCLMEYYLYPPKQINHAALAALAPPINLRITELEWPESPGPELHEQRLALSYADSMIRQDFRRQTATVLPPVPTAR